MLDSLINKIHLLRLYLAINPLHKKHTFSTICEYYSKLMLHHTVKELDNLPNQKQNIFLLENKLEIKMKNKINSNLQMLLSFLSLENTLFYG